uniref:Uncharacterized protein n=1 Tax=Sipha flava TaxID=143950 RepID=A0A2S2QRQ1_9HEMI
MLSLYLVHRILIYQKLLSLRLKWLMLMLMLSNVNLPEIVEQDIVESEIQLVDVDVNLVKNINKKLESFVQTNENGPICDVNTTSYDWSDPANWPQLLTNTGKK